MGLRGPKPKLHTFNGESLSLLDWAARTGICKQSLKNRLDLGWPIERVLTRTIKHGPDKRRKVRRDQKRLVVISAEQIFRAWASSPVPRV